MIKFVPQLILICLVLAGIGLVPMSQSFGEIDPSKVIVAYTFEDDADDLIRDWSGNRNHAKPPRGRRFKFVEEGKFGSAIELPVGADTCLDPGKPLMNELTEFTAAGWFNRVDHKKWGKPATNETFIEQANVFEWYNDRPASNAVLTFPATTERRGGVNILKPVSTIMKLPSGGDNQWTDEGSFVHMAVVGDTNQFTIYRNARRGALKKVKNLPKLGDLIHYGSSKNPTYIGGCGIAGGGPGGGLAGGDGNWFPGWIDDIIITAQALSVADLKILMNEGLESKSVGLLGLAVAPRNKLAITWGDLKSR